MRLHTLLVVCFLGTACAPMMTVARPSWSSEAGTDQEVLARYKLECTATWIDESCKIAGREVDMNRALALAELYPETSSVTTELSVRKGVMVTMMIAAIASLVPSFFNDNSNITNDFPYYGSAIGLLSITSVLAAVWQPLEDLAPAYNLALERELKESRTQLSAR